LIHLCTGCLDAPAEYEAIQRLPPQIFADSVDPPLTEVFEVPDPPPADTIPFNIPFRADDVASPLRANFLRDLDPKAREDVRFFADIQNLKQIATPYFEQTNRSLDWAWQVSNLKGCHSLTLILTYADNIPDKYIPADETQAAWVTWWFNFLDSSQPTDMSSCPPLGGDPLP
jgi:hypothetical protein